MGEIRKIAGTDEDRTLARPRALRNDLELHLVEVANSDQVQAALVEIDEWKPGGLLLTSFLTEKARSVVTQFAVDKGLSTIVDIDVWTRIAPPVAAAPKEAVRLPRCVISASHLSQWRCGIVLPIGAMVSAVIRSGPATTPCS